MKIYKSILVISDTHDPYTHPDRDKFLAALKVKYKPDKVYHIGDEVDGHSWSYHEHSPDLDAPNDELKKAIKSLSPLYKMFPNVTVLESNHGSLVYRKAITAGLPSKMIKSYRDILDAPKGWHWLASDIVHTRSGPVYLCHGKSAAPGKLSQLYGMSTVEGHYHESASVTYTSTPERLIFAVKTGCLVNDSALSMAYNKLNSKRPIISTVVIVDGIPHLHPMLLSKNGRWVGKL